MNTYSVFYLMIKWYILKEIQCYDYDNAELERNLNFQLEMICHLP